MLRFRALRSFLLMIGAILCVNMGYSAVYLPGTWNGWDNSSVQFDSTGMPSGFVKYTIYAVNDDEFKITKGNWTASENWSAGYWITSYDQVWNIPRNDTGGTGNAVITNLSSAGYVTVVSVSDPTANPQSFGFMYTSASPIGISSMSTGAVSPGTPVTINITLSGSKCAEENIYVRYSTNGWTSSALVSASGSGTSYSAVIPGMSAGRTVSYYGVNSSADSAAFLANADRLSLNINNNGGANYSYTVASDSTPPSWSGGYPTTNHIATNGVDILAEIDEAGKVFYVVVPDGAAAPSVANITNGKANGGASPVTAGNANVSASTTASIPVTGLDPSTAYDIYVVAQDSAVNVQAVSQKLDIDTIGLLILSELCDPQATGIYTNERYIEIYNPTGNPVDLTGWSVVAFANGYATHVHTWNLSGWIQPGEALTCGDDKCTVPHYFSDNTWSVDSYNWNGSNNDGAKLFDGTVLVDVYWATGSSYYWDNRYVERHITNTRPYPVFLPDQWYRKSQVSNNVFFVGTHTNDSADTSPPSWNGGYGYVTNIRDVTADLKSQINEAGHIYYVVVADGSTAPTVSDITNGKGYGGSTPIAGGNGAALANTTLTLSITGLESLTDYDLYVVAHDATSFSNLMTTAQLIEFTTTEVYGNVWMKGGYDSWNSRQFPSAYSAPGYCRLVISNISQSDQWLIGADAAYTVSYGSGYWVPDGANMNTVWGIPTGANGVFDGASFSQIKSYVVVTAATNISGSPVNFGFMTLSAYPVNLSLVSNRPVSAQSDVTVDITLNKSKSSEELIYVRYTTNGWSSSAFVQASGSGTAYSAQIPGMKPGRQVEYYGLSTTASSGNLSSNPDLLAISINNNGGANYSYTVPQTTRHTIAIDGVNDFFTNECIPTTTGGYTNYLTWDDTYFYVGYYGDDVDSGNADKVLVVYLSTNTNTGTAYGIKYNTQMPVLPFRADFVFNYITTTPSGSWDSARFTNNSWSWSPDAFTMAGGTDIYRIGNYIEMRFRKSELGDADWMDVYVQFVNKAGGSEWTYGKIPSNNKADNYNVIPTNYISFATDIWDNGKTPFLSSYHEIDTVLPLTNRLNKPLDGTIVEDMQELDIDCSAWDNAGIYKIEIYTNGSLLYTQYPTADNQSFITNMIVRGSMGDTNYIWSVAYDTRNRAYSSTNRYIFAVNNPPPKPVLTWPANGDTEFYLLKPRFKWTIGDDDEGDGISNFQILVSSNANLSDPHIISNFYTTQTNFLTKFTNYLENNKTWYWSVRANDGNSWGDWSDTNWFYIDPQYIRLDADYSEWPNVTFGGDNTDLITNGQWRWKDAAGDPWYRGIDYQSHLDLTEFSITADENCIFFMFKVPDLSAGSPRPYLSVAIDTNHDGSTTGFIKNAYAECAVNTEAEWDLEVIANVDGTGYFYPSGSDTNWYEWGENWITHDNNPGFGEIAMAWDEMGFATVPEKLRMTVNIGRVTDGLGNYLPTEIAGGPDFVDSISTNSGDTEDELTDNVNDCYFDINFDSDGRILANKFEVTPETNYIIAGVPFKVIIKAQTFLGGPALDYKRTTVADAYTNGSAYVLSNTGWSKGVTTNIMIINAAGSNKVLIADQARNDINGTSEWIYVVRPDLHLNEVCFDPDGANNDGQWVEIFNRGEQDIYMSGWALHDEDSTFPMMSISKKVILPSSNYLVLKDGTGTDDTNFADGRGIVYSQWGDYQLSVVKDEIGLFCSSTTRTKYTIMDFMAYGGDAGTDDDLAVSATVWDNGDYVSIVGFSEGASLVLLPDGDDTDQPSDWDIDNTPTPKYSNLDIISDNLTLVQQNNLCYQDSIVLGYEIVLVDPENDELTSGDALSNFVIRLNGTADTNDVIEAGLWNANGATQFNYGYNNNSQTNNLLMGYGTYSGAVNGFIFQNLSNNFIADSSSGGTMRVFLSLKLATNAVIGHDLNPYIMTDSIVMKSTYPTATGPKDKAVSNNQKMTIEGGRFVINEYTDAGWAGANKYQYQFVEVYNNSTYDIDPEAAELTISTRRGEDPVPLARGDGLGAGTIALITPGGTALGVLTNFYAENPSASILATMDEKIGSYGFSISDTPFMIRAKSTIVAIVDYTNDYSATGYTVERIDPRSGGYESSSFTNGTPGYWNGFRAVEMKLANVTNYSLDINTSNNVVLDFYIPNNNGVADTLSMITILNNGTAVDTDVSFNLYRDGIVSGFGGDETEIGAFAYQGDSRWSWTGSTPIPDTGGVDDWRFFVTADVPPTTTDGNTVRLQIESLLPWVMAPYDGLFTNGVKVSSFNDGPVDGIVSNTAYQVCGIANLSISKIVQTVELNDIDLPLPGALIIYRISYQNDGHGNARNVVIYDELPENTTYYTNYLGTAVNWEVQYSTNESPDQSYHSTDYNNTVTTNALWVRWRKGVVSQYEDGKTIYIGVTID